MSRTNNATLTFFFAIALNFYLCLSAPISNPLLNDSHIHLVVPKYFDSKTFRIYHNSTPSVLNSVPVVLLMHKDPTCKVTFKQRWSTNVGSSVYSTPVIFPSGPEGKKQIFLNTFYEFVEIIGQDGYKPWGWPLTFEGSSFQGSPILFDIDGDGYNDLGAADKDGNLFWVRIGTFGQYLDDYHVKIPKLKIQKNWYENINPEYIDSFVMMSMFDHETSEEGKKKAKQDGLAVVQASYPESGGFKKGSNSRRRLTEEESLDHFESEFSGGFEKGKKMGEEVSSGEFPEIQDDDEHRFNGHFKHFDLPEGLNGSSTGEWIDHGETNEEMADDYVAVHGREEYYGHYGRRHRVHESYMDDGVPYFGDPVTADNKAFVFLDAHVLGSPSMADVNGDGHMDVLMAVSYYFDKAEYAGTQLDFDPSMYVAGGVVCWDLKNQAWAWTVHLDLTTDHTKFKALIYGSPTVADLNGDGRLEVIIGTSLGLLYVLDGETGFVRRFFPMQFHEIQATVAVADVRGGSDLEILVADIAGNIAVVDLDGEVLWDRQLTGALYHTPTVGDVDGDGEMDIVIVSVSEAGSHVWALRGSTGVPLSGYPISLPQSGVASAPSLLVDLHMYDSYTPGTNKMDPLHYSDRTLPPWLFNSAGHEPAAAPSMNEFDPVEDGTGFGVRGSDGAEGHRRGSIRSSSMGKNASSTRTRGSRGSGSGSKGLHILVPSHDGHLYVIDGLKGCAERVDVGEHIYSMPLADDVTGDGFLDIILGTMNGQVLVLETEIPYHPMNSWSSFPKHRVNGFTHGGSGVSVPLFQKRLFEQVSQVKSGNVLPITIDIWDVKHTSTENQKYTITVSRGTNAAASILEVEFAKPGRYVINVPVVPPESMNLVIKMKNEHGQYFEDIVYVSISTRFYVWIKYLIMAPIVLFVAPLLMMRGNKGI